MKKITLSAVAVLSILPSALSAEGFSLFSDANLTERFVPVTRVWMIKAMRKIKQMH